MACRVDFHPVGRPSRSGELAKAATNTGPSACSRRQRQPTLAGPPSRSPASRQTCTEAVLHIISRPHGPARLKNSSIAAYRGTSSTR
jgi:hypothetical protein